MSDQIVIITAKQKRVLDALREITFDAGGRPPTLQELCDHLGYARFTSVQRHLAPLLKKGLVKHEFYKSRSYVACDFPFKAVPCAWSYQIDKAYRNKSKRAK